MLVILNPDVMALDRNRDRTRPDHRMYIALTGWAGKNLIWGRVGPLELPPKFRGGVCEKGLQGPQAYVIDANV